MVVRTAHPTAVLRDLTTWAIERGEELDGLTVTRPSLEDVYLQLTGRRTTRRHERRRLVVAASVRQTRWERKMFWRNPPLAGFTFAFPLMFLVIFAAINGNDTRAPRARHREVRAVLTCPRSSRSV